MVPGDGKLKKFCQKKIQITVLKERRSAPLSCYLTVSFYFFLIRFIWQLVTKCLSIGQLGRFNNICSGTSNLCNNKISFIRNFTLRKSLV